MATTKSIQPIGNRLLVEYVEEEASTSKILIPDSSKEDREAIVIEVGTGNYDINGKKVPMEFVVGNRVLVSNFGGKEIKVNGKKYILTDAENVLAILK